ncbi:hypothetical protein S225a_10240 [Candidatus Brocadiaceae bacterium S225]|uniref:Uncharacterized protein n=1 Tax=Candidatus Scalindua brodae TaxID=237368 RepID=A0A0B0EDS4_9BACT|nr:MAG: hypothetical protein SCABRO_02895 [Candidatus Scalindua brodae]TWU34666.1 hypothetical protein S225a_10240 [Candidatus Brocadiaceae bacterium S225]
MNRHEFHEFTLIHFDLLLKNRSCFYYVPTFCYPMMLPPQNSHLIPEKYLNALSPLTLLSYQLLLIRAFPPLSLSRDCQTVRLTTLQLSIHSRHIAREKYNIGRVLELLHFPGEHSHFIVYKRGGFTSFNSPYLAPYVCLFVRVD